MSQNGPRKVDGPRNVLMKAWEDISPFDIAKMAVDSGSMRRDEGGLIIRFFNRDYSVDPVKREIRRIEGGETPNPFIASLILHYLMRAKNMEPSGRLLTFRELEGGNIYYDAFYRRAIEPLALEIGSTPAILLARAKRVGGVSMNLGDASAKIPVFPRVPVVAVVWRGDDEVASSANILFDSTAGLHLHTEDLAAVGDLTADALVLSDEEWRGW